MIVALIVVCEVGFWVLLAVGLAVRSLGRMPRAGAAVLLCEPLLEVLLLAATAAAHTRTSGTAWPQSVSASPSPTATT